MLTSETKPAATASALSRKEWFEQTRKRREISCLNEYLSGAVEFGHHSLTAKKASKESALRSLSQVVLHVTFPCDEMAGIDDVLFTGTQDLPMNGAERRYEQKSGAAYLQHEQTFTAEERFSSAELRIDDQRHIPGEI